MSKVSKEKQKNYSRNDLFSLANQIRKNEKVTQKESFAMAKEQLEGKKIVSLGSEVVSKMKKHNVKFTFDNGRGKLITTTGTLRLKEKVPVNRKVEGRKTPKMENNIVFYDVRHGVYRQFDKNKVTEILAVTNR